MEKITPRIDIAFKKIFGVEENKDLLISLINSIVSEEDQVVDLTLLNPYNNKNFAKDKLSILDVKAKGVDGKLFNIEIQITDDADYDKRALYYWAKLYTEQLQAGSDYGQLSKAIGIHILNFISIPQAEKYHNVFHIHEKETGVRYFKDLELHTIELKKFSPNSQEGLDELVSKIQASIDIWAAFLTRHELLNKESLPSPLNNPELKKALGVLEVMNFGEEERDAYEERLKWLRVEANTLKKYEKKGREEGRAEGREEGRQEGRVEGEQIGLEKVALNMLQKGLSPLDIHELTGLDEKVIDRLCNNIMSPIK